MPTRTVILRHHTPDGAWHYDWMLERCPGGPLRTFRIMERPDAPACGPFDAEPLPDHRSVYLEFEGEISGGRGSVERAASGVVVSMEEQPGTLRVRVAFGGVERTWVGCAAVGGGWRFEPV